MARQNTSPARTIEDHPAVVYARSVVNSERLACRWVRLACDRFLRDLERDDLIFDTAAADRACDFIEAFRHYKGEWAGRRLRMELWQKFVVANIFGFKLKSTGRRRFKYAHIEVPRKNGKTLLAAGISLYLLCADGEGGAEVYNAATKKDQALILHKDARVLIQKSRDETFLEAFEIKKNPPQIEYGAANAIMRPLGRDTEGDTTDGLNPHGIIADETHAWTAEGFWNVLNSALGARSQPLFMMITTAGHNPNSIGRKHSRIVQRILKGEDGGEGDDYFGIIYTIDEGDDPQSPTSWEKANPLYGTTVDERKMKSAWALANADPSIRRELLTKALNIWSNQASLWLDSEKWKKCTLPFDPSEILPGMRCYGGLDLAITRDLSAFILVFPPQGPLERWTLLCRFWCPAEDIHIRSKRDKVPYQTWAEKGFIVATPGEVMDHGYIHRQILEDCETYDVRGIGYDRAYSTHLIQPLLDEGIPMLAFSQGIMTISPYAKELERLVIMEKLNHFDHPVLAWNAGNAVVKTDANGNIKPEKAKAEERMDGIVATIIGLGIAIEAEYEADESGDFEVTVLR